MPLVLAIYWPEGYTHFGPVPARNFLLVAIYMLHSRTNDSSLACSPGKADS